MLLLLGVMFVTKFLASSPGEGCQLSEFASSGSSVQQSGSFLSSSLSSRHPRSSGKNTTTFQSMQSIQGQYHPKVSIY